MRNAVLAILLQGFALAQWTTMGRDPQHTGRSSVSSQGLTHIHWSTPVDATYHNTPGTLYIHFGTPVITAANTVLVPVRGDTPVANTFTIEAHDGATGVLKYTLSTDYILPPHGWTPAFGGVLTARNRYYYPCAGGTVCYRDTPDSASGASGRIAFYGNANYQANPSAFNGAVMISTPLTADRYGNIYFGFVVTGANPALLVSGLARISATGTGTWISATSAANDPSITQIPLNGAPALSNDQTTLYFPVNSGGFSGGYLVSASAATLTPLSRVRLKDPMTGNDARVPDDSSAVPTVGMDGDVYFGVFESGVPGNAFNNNDRGWMLHFNSTLTVSKIPGAFGWDATASIVPRVLVPSYTGTSQYLLFTKYNNYKDVGGDGLNRLAILDPNSSMTDPITGAAVMKEVITVLGLTDDGPPAGAVREWCINSAAIDPVTKSALVNSEDGKLYRWDFTSNTLSQTITLTPGVGEAYTPTVIGQDGTVYAINDAVLFAVGN